MRQAMKGIMRDYFRIYFVAFIAAMFAYCFDWIDKIELLLSVLFLVACYTFLVLCQIKSILEEISKKTRNQ